MRSSQLTNWSTPAPSMAHPGNLFEGNKILNWVLSVQKYITEHAGRFKGWKKRTKRLLQFSAYKKLAVHGKIVSLKSHESLLWVYKVLGNHAAVSIFSGNASPSIQAKQQVHHDDEAKHVGLMLEPNKAA